MCRHIRDNARYVNGGAVLLSVAAVVAQGIGAGAGISVGAGLVMNCPYWDRCQRFSVIIFTLKWF